MYLEELAPSWRDFHRRLLAQARVLIVDDDEQVAELLARLLGREGFSTQKVETAGEALSTLGAETFDLALVDANLPDDSGLTLLEKARAAGIETEVVLITGYATAETVDEALALGAADYLTKPLESAAHFVGRVRAVLDRRITTLLFEVITRDLSVAVHSGVLEPRAYAELSEHLLAHRVALGRRPQVVIVDGDGPRGEFRRAALARERCAARVVAPADAAGAAGPDGPLVAVVSLEERGALGLIERLHAADGQLEILACADAAGIDTALAAVGAGAADFALIGREGSRTLARRVERLLRRTRRHRSYLHLVRALYRAAAEANPALAEDLVFATRPADRAYIDGSAGK